MTILTARYRSGTELLAHLLPDLPHSGLFFPTRRRLEVGQPVLLSVRLGPRRPPATFRAHVAWRRPGRHSIKQRAGLALAFDADETDKRDFLVDLARGERGTWVPRRHARMPVDLPVFVVLGSGAERPGLLRDIGRGGALINLVDGLVPEPTPAREDDVVLSIAPPGAAVPMAVTARVAWAGPRSGLPSLGLAWRARDAGGVRRIKELVRRISADTATA